MVKALLLIVATLLVSVRSMPADYFRFSMTIGDGSPVVLQPLYFNMTTDGDLYLVAFGSTFVASNREETVIDEPDELEPYDIEITPYFTAVETDLPSSDNIFLDDNNEDKFIASVDNVALENHEDKKVFLFDTDFLGDRKDEESFIMDNELSIQDGSDEQWHIDTNNV